jgi:hypothetical protein
MFHFGYRLGEHFETSIAGRPSSMSFVALMMSPTAAAGRGQLAAELPSSTPPAAGPHPPRLTIPRRLMNSRINPAVFRSARDSRGD